MSTWGYSSWVFKYGPAEMGKFESQRKQCLEQAGGPTATDENSFIQCMNQNGWCTREFACQPPSD